MDDPLQHALRCQPSTSTSTPSSHQSRPTDPVSPSGSNGSANTTTTMSSSIAISPLQQQPLKQILPLRSPSLNTTTSTATPGSVKRLFSKTPAPLSARARLVPSIFAILPPTQRLVQVYTLTKETLAIAVEQKCPVWDVYHCCCSHLGIDDTRFLGLALRMPSEGIGCDSPRHEYYFLQNDQKLTKYVPSKSRTWAKTSATDKSPLLVLYLRVRVYAECIEMISCRVALHHYYLQLRENLLDHWSGPNSVREERCWELAALALQADDGAAPLGNDTPNNGSFRAERYFPLWVINMRGLDYIRKNMPKVRTIPDPRSVAACSYESKKQFCLEASRSPLPLNCHLYGLRRHKQDNQDNALLGITDKGVDMWDVGPEGERIPIRSLCWNKMVSLAFKHRKITVGGVDKLNTSLYACSSERASYLLHFCRDVHQQLIQINIHYAYKKPSSEIPPPPWCKEISVDSTRPHRLHALPPIQASSSATSTPAQASPASNIVASPSPAPPMPNARGASPHPLMRIHEQHSVDSFETSDSRQSSTKENPSTAIEPVPKQSVKRSSGGARARISGNTSSTERRNGRFEPNGSTARHSRISPSNDSGDSLPPPTNDIETFLNSAASPPRYQFSGDEEVNSQMTTSTISAVSMPAMSTAQNAMPMDAAERRAHFVTSRTFDDHARVEPTPLGAHVDPASRSMHDLRSRMPPPPYMHALAQLNGQAVQHPPAQIRQYPPPPTHQTPTPQRMPTRSGTVIGADTEMQAYIDRLSMQNGAVPRPLPSYPGEQYMAFHRGVSEPRLNMTVQPMPQQAIVTNVANGTRPPMNPTNSVTPTPADPTHAKRRYASRSPSSRGINRVKSMPSSAMSASDLQVRNAEANGTAAVSTTTNGTTHFAKQPPPYDHALQLQSAASRKSALEKRNSTSGIDMARSKHQYSFLQMLMQENNISGGLPSSSTSDETLSSATVTPPMQANLSGSPQHESSAERLSPAFEDNMSTPPRSTIIPPAFAHVASAGSAGGGSPPSPPFYYAGNGGPLLWNNGATRGEYLFQDQHIQALIANANANNAAAAAAAHANGAYYTPDRYAAAAAAAVNANPGYVPTFEALPHSFV
uniref:FERM domain-containing protein n=1 Tax=Panagrellus redivivus TaxID=6233 RepID=A0A7E4VHJ9_PANRE